jgi:hypothetical protein
LALAFTLTCPYDKIKLKTQSLDSRRTASSYDPRHTNRKIVPRAPAPAWVRTRIERIFATGDTSEPALLLERARMRQKNEEIECEKD